MKSRHRELTSQYRRHEYDVMMVASEQFCNHSFNTAHVRYGRESLFCFAKNTTNVDNCEAQIAGHKIRKYGMRAREHMSSRAHSSIPRNHQLAESLDLDLTESAIPQSLEITIQNREITRSGEKTQQSQKSQKFVKIAKTAKNRTSYPGQ